MDFASDKYILRDHKTDPSKENYDESNDEDLSEDPTSLLYVSSLQGNWPKLLVWVTMYNEPPIQLVESLIGIYRAYYELVDWKNEFEDKVQIVIIIDGYDIMSKEHLKFYEKVGIYNSFWTKDYKQAVLNQDKTSYQIKFRGKCLNL